MTFRFLCIGMVPMLLFGAPFIPPRGIVNGASFLPAALPGGSIAQGSIFTVFGSGLGPSTPMQASAFPLTPALGGVSVKVFQGSTSVTAYPVFVSSGQLNVVMPSNAPTGRVSVQVTYNGAASNPAPITVVNNSFGIFSANSAGNGPGIVNNFVTQDTQPVNSLVLAAMPGQTEILWGTGLGPLTTPDNIAPLAGSLPTKVEVFVGGILASVNYSGRTPCCSGVDQIIFTIPPNAPLGCYVPVQVRTGGITVANSVTIAITADASSCVATLPPLSQAFVKGGNVGIVQMMSLNLHTDIELAAADTTVDAAEALFQKVPANPFFYQPLVSVPAAGTCVTYAAATDFTDLTQFSSLFAMSGTALDSGSVGMISGAGGAIPLLPFGSGDLGNLLGSPNIALTNVPASRYYTSGNYTLSTLGGTDVGAVSVTSPYTPPVNWTNRDASSVVTVNRSQPLTLNWTGADPNAQVLIFGGNADIPTNSTGIFLCTAPPGAGAFTIPAQVLATIPPARLISGQQTGILSILVAPSAAGTSFPAKGLDTGSAFFFSQTARTVIFQ